MLALDTEPRFQAVFAVVKPGVNDLGVSRGNAGAIKILFLDDHNLAPRPRQRAGDGEADNARADDEGFDRLHQAITFRKASTSSVVVWAEQTRRQVSISFPSPSRSPIRA